MKVRRNYLLLEAIVSIALISICIVPMLVSPARLFQRQLKEIEMIEMDRCASQLAVEVKRQLYREEIPWEAFGKKGKKFATKLPTVSQHLDWKGMFHSVYELRPSIWLSAEKIDPVNRTYREVVLKIEVYNKNSKLLREIKYKYLVMRLPPSESRP